MRFLIVSDNVGTPSRPRGIFTYTTNLIRALHQCGHDVSLLVQRPPHSELPRREHTRLAARSGAATDIVRLGAIYHHLWQSERLESSPRRRGPRRFVASLLRLPAEAIPFVSAHGLKLLLRRRVVLPLAIVPNRLEQLDFVPPHLDFLRACSNIALSDSVYSLGFATAFLGLDPPIIDARGFDVILVDTPSHFRFERSQGAEVVAVVHDLLPLSDATCPHAWRRLFVNKVVQTIDQVDSFIFVSEFIRRRFHEAFPSVARLGSTILHPSVADDIADEVPSRTELASGGAGDREYIVGILADEPRKNIRTLIDAWALLPGEIGLKLVGDIDPAHYGLNGGSRERSRIELVGYVDEATKRRLIAGSVGLVMPSLSEGFGIPLVEGFLFGKPVFCSDLPVFHEVAGENAIYFDGHSARAIAEAIGAYLEGPGAFADRVRRGREDCRRRFTVSVLRERVAQRFSVAASRPHGEA